MSSSVQLHHISVYLSPPSVKVVIFKHMRWWLRREKTVWRKITFLLLWLSFRQQKVAAFSEQLQYFVLTFLRNNARNVAKVNGGNWGVDFVFQNVYLHHKMSTRKKHCKLITGRQKLCRVCLLLFQSQLLIYSLWCSLRKKTRDLTYILLRSELGH